ncbi:MAG: hypothetical protein HY532_03590 [Chloroflexi bacterium]|nr:hypothetical protein [Chloroflexota bacterium]
MSTQEQNFRYSTVREQMLEHLFVSELMQEAWFGRKQPMDVLRSEVDSSGYDLVVECNGITRHIQLKSSLVESKKRYLSVSAELARKPSGCVIWLRIGPDATGRRVSIGYYFWGSAAGKPLPDLGAFQMTKHTKANVQGTKAERPGHHNVPPSQFKKVSSVQELAEILFGLPVKGHTF